MKKSVVMALSIALSAMLAISGTLAYLQDQDEAVNVMTLGSVYIDQIEQEWNADKTELVEFKQNKPLYPAVYEGTSIQYDEESYTDADHSWKKTVANPNVVDKFVTVTNTGKSEAYVRTVIAYEGDGDVLDTDGLIHVVHNDGSKEGTKPMSTEEFKGVDINGVKYDVIIYTYEAPLQPGDTTVPSLKQLYMGKEAGNDYVAKFGETYDVLVLSQAVQTNGFENAKAALNAAFKAPDPTVIAGWFGGMSPVVTVTNTEELAAALKKGNTSIRMAAGNYEIPTEIAGKTVALIGSGDDTVIDFTKAYGVDGANITFENMKFQGKNENVMHNFGIWYTTGDITYKNCTFDGAVTNENNANVKYIDCTFTGTGYITTYSVPSASFINCTFDKADSRALLVYSHGDNPVKVNVEDCTFLAAEKGYTGVPEWTAAVEIDTTNIKTPGTSVTIKNCTHDANYNGIVRDKSAANSTPPVIDNEGNAQVTTVGNADALIKALENGENVAFTDNIMVAKTETGSNGYGATGITVLNGQTIDGNGNKFGVNAWSTWDSAINTTGGTIKNLTVNSGMRGIFINHNSTHFEKVVLENVTIDGTVYTISCDQGTNQGLEAYNSTFNGWTSYAATIGNVKFVDCSFGEGQGYSYSRPYAPTEYVNCAFEAGHVLDPRAAVTFENCTLDGVALTADNLDELVDDDYLAYATVK